MDYNEAIVILNDFERPVASKMDALQFLIDDENSSLNDIRLGLNHEEAVAERAMFGLYSRTKTPYPEGEGRLMNYEINEVGFTHEQFLRKYNPELLTI